MDCMLLNTQNKWIIFILVDFTIILIFICYLGVMRHINPINGVFIKNPIEIKSFHLIDNHGNSLTKNDLKGNWTFLFFGFTHCKMICPTTLATLNKTYLLLQKDLPLSKLPKIIFVTIDPEHDSIDQLNQYVNSFNKNFIGAKADINETVSLEKDLHVTISKVNDTLNHTSDIILLNQDVKIQAYFPFPNYYQKLADDYKIIIKY